MASVEMCDLRSRNRLKSVLLGTAEQSNGGEDEEKDEIAEGRAKPGPSVFRTVNPDPGYNRRHEATRNQPSNGFAKLFRTRILADSNQDRRQQNQKHYDRIDDHLGGFVIGRRFCARRFSVPQEANEQKAHEYAANEDAKEQTKR